MNDNSANGGVQSEVETKLIDTPIRYGNDQVILKDQLMEEAKAFGWSVSSTRVTTTARTHHKDVSYIMIRDTHMPHYKEITECEYEYKMAETELKNYVSADFLDALLLLLLFIVPGVIYIVVKCVKKAKVYGANDAAVAKMKEAINKAKIIATKD